MPGVTNYSGLRKESFLSTADVKELIKRTKSGLIQAVYRVQQGVHSQPC